VAAFVGIRTLPRQSRKLWDSPIDYGKFKMPLPELLSTQSPILRAIYFPIGRVLKEVTDQRVAVDEKNRFLAVWGG
jgi:hypothetical protein